MPRSQLRGPRIIVPLVGAVALAASCYRSRADRLRGADEGAYRIVPAGATELRPASDGADQWRTFARVDSADTATRPIGRVRLESRAVAGSDSILTLTRTQPPSTTFVDTVVLRRVGLAPIRETLRSAQRSMEIRYLGDSVHSVTYRGDSVVRVAARRFAYAPFAFNQLELVLTRLPLRVGYRVRIPLYSEGDDSVEVDTVSVVAVTGGARPQWRVRFADPAAVRVYAIDSLTRRVQGIEEAFIRATPWRRWHSVAER